MFFFFYKVSVMDTFKSFIDEDKQIRDELFLP